MPSSLHHGALALSLLCQSTVLTYLGGVLQNSVRVVEAVVQRLLAVAVADTSAVVRRMVLETFVRPSPLDEYLAQADRYACCC